jgi:HSP20 family protein
MIISHFGLISVLEQVLKVSKQTNLNIMIVVKNKNCAPQTANRGWNSTPFNQFFAPEFQNFFGSDFQSQTPAVNIVEDEKNFIIEVAAPGLAKEDFKIDLNKEMLTISADKKMEDDSSTDVQDKKKPNYIKKEFSYNSFKRNFKVTDKIETSGISASYENGVLKVILPKKEKSNEETSKTITIK